MLERFNLPAQLLDLLIFNLGELLFLQLDLLVLVLKIIEELSHLGQLVLMLKFNHLQLGILEAYIVLDQLPFPI